MSNPKRRKHHGLFRRVLEIGTIQILPALRIRRPTTNRRRDPKNVRDGRT